ncbi:M43 family zinc metalloprotease [Roseivirga sp.]|uniref:M43 family zinc metalloprotease n=1 Tax=Roseivirga sp. TaxID=1964215 RepID=UPI003B515F55
MKNLINYLLLILMVTACSERSIEDTLPDPKEPEVYRIPIVIHVLHMGDPVGQGDNLSMERIKSQIRVLNEDFRRKPNTNGFNDDHLSKDAGIEFYLAQIAPDGTSTNGVNRVDINSQPPPGFGGNRIAMGAHYIMWDPEKYLNIWTWPGVKDTGVGEARFPVSDLPGLEDEAYMVIPGVDNLSGFPIELVDGIAITSMHFGVSDLDSPYNLGRTGTHEMGHFLGLLHIWGDDEHEGTCEADDFCDDTPPTKIRTLGSPNNLLACDGSAAMVENYMDYTDDIMMNKFTKEQIARMRYVLENSPRRKTLVNQSLQ